MTTHELLVEVQSRLPIYYRHKFKYKQLKMILEHLLDATVDAVAYGEDVKLHCFGVFSPEVRKFRRNLQDSSVYEGIRIAFRPSKKFKRVVKDVINGGRLR